MSPAKKVLCKGDGGVQSHEWRGTLAVLRPALVVHNVGFGLGHVHNSALARQTHRSFVWLLFAAFESGARGNSKGYVVVE